MEKDATGGSRSAESIRQPPSTHVNESEKRKEKKKWADDKYGRPDALGRRCVVVRGHPENS